MLNKIRENVKTYAFAASHPAVPTSGQWVRYGEIIGVAAHDEQLDGMTTFRLDSIVVEMPVHGVDQVGNSAVAAGDKLFALDADHPNLSKKNTGRFFGYALGAVASGDNTGVKIQVLKPAVS